MSKAIGNHESISKESGNPENSKESGNPESSVSPYRKQIIDSVIQLNIARKNAFIYPPEHDQVKSSVETAWKILNSLLKSISTLTLGIAGDNIMIGKEDLDPGNAVCRDFALSLKHHDIASITFDREMQIEDLQGFLSLVAKNLDDIEDNAGIPKRIQQENISHIDVKVVDYSQLHLTEEKEISRIKDDETDEKGGQTWQTFVSHLVSNTITNSDKGISPEKLEGIDPVYLSKLLNEKRIDPENAIRTYDKVIAKHFSMGDSNKSDSSGKKTQEESDSDMSNWNTLLQELNPDLKKQFLSVTFNHIEPEGHSENKEEFLESMSGALVIDMLKQANKKGKEISPSLLGLIQKLSKTQEQWQEGPEGFGEDLQRRDEDSDDFSRPLGDLFEREKHEEYVVSEYDDILKKLADQTQTEIADEHKDFSLKESLKTLEDNYLDSRIARIVMSFMNAEIKRDEYKIYAEKLIGIGRRLIDVPDFGTLLLIVKTFQVHSKKKSDVDIKAIAAQAADSFKKPAFTSKAIAGFFKDGKLTNKEGFNLLIALGPGIVPDVVKLYSAQDQPIMSGLLSELMTHFRKEASLEVQKRLHDNRVSVVRNLIVLLRILDARDAENNLKALLDHKNTDIQLEAIETLLKFENPDALPVLKKLIRTGRDDVSARAIFYAGKYKIKDVVSTLKKMLKRFILFRSDFKRNRDIISALGRIGEPEVMAVLEKLAKTSWPLFPSEMSKMKLSIFESLAGYPNEDTKTLLEIGKRYGGADIKNECARILKIKKNEMVSEAGEK